MSYLDILEKYRKLLITQYRNKPKAQQTMELLTNSSVCDGLPLALKDAFNLDTAYGEQLTILGKIVGIPRNILGLDLSHIFFTATRYSGTPACVGFTRYNSGPSSSLILRYHTDASYTLSDTELLTLIKLKIIANTRWLSYKNVEDGLNNYFGGDIYLDSISNSQNTLLDNGNFETWSGGPTANPDSWNNTFGTGNWSQESSTVKIGSYACKATNSNPQTILTKDISTVKGLSYWANRQVAFGCWVWSAHANTSYLQIADGVNPSISVGHPGDSIYRFLSLTFTVSNSPAYVDCNLITSGNNTYDTFFDGAVSVDGPTVNPSGYGDFNSPYTMFINYNVNSKYRNAFIAALFIDAVPRPMGVSLNTTYF